MPTLSRSALPAVKRVGAEGSLWLRTRDAFTFKLTSRRLFGLDSLEGETEDGDNSLPVACMSV